MSYSKLYALISTIKEADWGFVLDALESPAFNKHTPLVRRRLAKFAEQIWNNCPKLLDNNTTKSTEQQIWAVLYPNKTYQDGRMRQEKTALLREIVNILPFLYFKKDSIAQQICLLEHHAASIALHSNFEKQCENYQDQQVQFFKNQPQDISYYYQRLYFEEILSVYYTQKAKHVGHLNLSKTAQAVDTYFVAQQLRFALYFLNRTEDPYQHLPFLQTTIEHIAQNVALYEPMTTIWTRYKMFELLSNTQTQIIDIKQHIELLQNSLSFFSEQEKNNLYNYLLNFIIGQLNNSVVQEKNEQYWQLLYRLYTKIGIDKKLLYRSNGCIAPTELRNVFIAALNAYNSDEKRAKVAQEMQQWIVEIKDKIIDNEDQSYFNAIQSFLWYIQKEYEKCTFSIYINTMPPNVAWILYICRVNIKALYEAQKEEQLEIELHNFKTSLYRNSIKGHTVSEQQKTMYLNFVKVLFKIIHPKTNWNKDRIAKINLEIEDLPLVEKKWLLYINRQTK